jgi:hypothetical protein
MSEVLLTGRLLEEQGYGAHETFVCNKSAILLQKNRGASSIKQTCHINIQYFL